MVPLAVQVERHGTKLKGFGGFCAFNTGDHPLANFVAFHYLTHCAPYICLFCRRKRAFPKQPVPQPMAEMSMLQMSEYNEHAHIQARLCWLVPSILSQSQQIPLAHLALSFAQQNQSDHSKDLWHSYHINSPLSKLRPTRI
jgi:hypothetical protein